MGVVWRAGPVMTEDLEDFAELKKRPPPDFEEK